MRQESNHRMSSRKEGQLKISNSRAMGVIILIALLFVFQVTTFVIHKVRTSTAATEVGGVGNSSPQGERQPVLFKFNPNTITLDSLQMLGFTPKQAQSILNYRAKGGVFRKKGDFAKLYVVDSARYAMLEGYILFPQSVSSAKGKPSAGPPVKVPAPGNSKGSDVPAKDTSRTIYGQKVEKNRYVCNLNTADSAALVQLYGIGGYYANKILEYRERLGGSFVHKRQLLEIRGFTQERYNAIEENIAVFEEDVIGFSLLQSSTEALGKHPYIGKYAARGIGTYLRLKGKDAFANELQLLEELVNEHILTENNALRLREYLLHL